MHHRFAIHRKLIQKVSNVQRKATTWICFEEDDYNKRLLQLDIQLVSLYPQIQEVLFFNATQNEKYHIRVNIPSRYTDKGQKELRSTKDLYEENGQGLWDAIISRRCALDFLRDFV